MTTLALLAVQVTDPSTIAIFVGTALATFVTGIGVQRRWNGRRNHGIKPGHGEVCEKYGDGISANTASIAALGAYQATYQQNQDAIQGQLKDIRDDVKALLGQREN